MKKLNKISAILPVIAPILLLGIAISLIIYAWYVSVISTGEIDATTKNLIVEYTFNDDTDKNKKTYNVRNLAFFDTDNPNETSYLSGMAVKLDIALKNNSTSDVSYEIVFTTTKDIIYSNDYEVIEINDSDEFDDIKNYSTPIYVRSGENTEESPYVYTQVATYDENEVYYIRHKKSVAYVDGIIGNSEIENYAYGYSLATVVTGKDISGIYYEKNVTYTAVATNEQYDDSKDYYIFTYVEKTIEDEDDFNSKKSNLYIRTGSSEPYTYVLQDSADYDENEVYYVAKYILADISGFVENVTYYTQSQPTYSQTIDTKFVDDKDYYIRTTDSTLQNVSTGTINDLRFPETNVTGVSYTDSYNAITRKITGILSPYEGPGDELVISLYLFGVQEIDDAVNGDFIYESNDSNVMKTYPFTLSFEAKPIGEVIIDENIKPSEPSTSPDSDPEPEPSAGD